MCYTFIFLKGWYERMKRVKAACICQTLHFLLKEGIDHDDAVALVRREVEHYRRRMEENRIKYKIVEEQEQPDGSIVVKVMRQYNSTSVGDYLD